MWGLASWEICGQKKPEQDKRRVSQASLSLTICSWPGTDHRMLHQGHPEHWPWLTLDSRLGPACLCLETSVSGSQSKFRVEILAILLTIHSRFVTLEIATGFLQSMRQAHFAAVIFINNNQFHLPLCKGGCPERMSCLQVFPVGTLGCLGCVLSLTLSAPGDPGLCLGDLREDKASHPWVQHDSPICAHSCKQGKEEFQRHPWREKTVCS